VRIEAPKRGIDAQLEDQDDYYWHPNGSKIKFFRKKDVFALRMKQSRSRSKSLSPMTQLKATFGERIKEIKSHRLANTMVVRVSNPGSKGFRAKQATMIDENTLRAGQANVTEVVPVLANAKGHGDILVSDNVLVKLKSGVDPEAALESLNDRFGLTLIRQAKVSGNVYSMRASSKRSTGAKFQFVRRLAKSVLVEWAQPQFSSRPFKTQFSPNNDSLFGEQWHLENSGYRGSLCDADCDASDAWSEGNPANAAAVGASAGSDMVIAVIDDGVQLNHPEFNFWQNSGEIPNNGMDDDGNGFIDDVDGWDFVDDSTTILLDANDDSQPCPGASDGDSGPDNDPNGNDFANCITVEGDPIEQDDHGTAVAGLAGARANNVGTIGTAFLAEIMPIRLISDFDSNDSNDFCMRAAEALTYAGRHADVINNSWGIDEGTCPMLDAVIDDIVAGALTDNGGANISHRANGSPVIFASGNSASGWVKVTANVSAGEHAYEWRFLRTNFLGNDTNFTPEFSIGDDDTAYLDDILFPDNVLESFESGLGDLTTQCDFTFCTEDCTEFDRDDPLFTCPVWGINTNTDFVRSGSQSAQIDQFDTFCTYSYLHTQRDGPAGTISFYVWVNTDQQVGSDKFEFLIDGQEVVSFGDLPNFIDNNVGYPANVLSAIAVGASDSGDLINRGSQSTGDLSSESRIFYSQFGAELDVVAPSGNQHLGIFTTDRFGVNSPGFNSNADIDGDGSPDPNYTNSFGGTSASAPIVAGIAAAVIASDPGNDISAAAVETLLQSTADEIGMVPYVNGRNDFHGHGRVNMFRALRMARGQSDTSPAISCNAQGFDYNAVAGGLPGNDRVLAGFSPVNLSGFTCPANGPLIPDDSFCFPIITQNNSAAVICL